VWSMSGGEMTCDLDATYAEIARLEIHALHLVAGLESTAHAQEVGAGTTARFLALRYRIDATKARRDVRLAMALPKYPAVAAALPTVCPATPTDLIGPASTGEDSAGEGGVGVLLHPGQAEAIVSALEKVPATVAAGDIEVAESALVKLGRTHGPEQLRAAGRLVRDRLDTDGPEPAEQKAYDREALRLKKADNGVAFSGYLANENAELFRSLVHTGAKPRKTVDGALDPRSRDQRQADALITILAAADSPATTPPAHSGGAASDASSHESMPAGPTPAGPTATGATPAGPPADGAANDTHRAGVAANSSDSAGSGVRRGGGVGWGRGSKPQITVT